MSDLVRARITVGDEVITTNIGASHARIHDLDVVDEPTRTATGDLRPAERTRARSGRPAKTKTSVSTEAAKKQAGESADTMKES